MSILCYFFVNLCKKHKNKKKKLFMDRRTTQNYSSEPHKIQLPNILPIILNCVIGTIN